MPTFSIIFNIILGSKISRFAINIFRYMNVSAFLFSVAFFRTVLFGSALPFMCHLSFPAGFNYHTSGSEVHQDGLVGSISSSNAGNVKLCFVFWRGPSFFSWKGMSFHYIAYLQIFECILSNTIDYTIPGWFNAFHRLLHFPFWGFR